MCCCTMRQHSRSRKRNQHAQNSFLNSENPIAQRRREKWINFVLAKRKNWEPGKTSSLCLIHFKEEDFQFCLDSKMKRSLKSDKVGICVCPSIQLGSKAIYGLCLDKIQALPVMVLHSCNGSQPQTRKQRCENFKEKIHHTFPEIQFFCRLASPWFGICLSLIQDSTSPGKLA